MKGPGLNISWRNKIPMSGLVWQSVCVSTSNYVTQPSLFNQTHHFLFKVEPMKPKKRILQDAAKRPIFCMWYFRWWYMVVGLRTAKSQPECFRERKYWSCSCTPCVALGPIAHCTRFLYKIKANPYFGSALMLQILHCLCSFHAYHAEKISALHTPTHLGDQAIIFCKLDSIRACRRTILRQHVTRIKICFFSIWRLKEQKSPTEYSVLLPETITLCFVIQGTRQRRGLVTGVPFFTLSM